MNTNQIKGSLKSMGGKIRRKAGAAVGSPRQQAKGAADEAEGKAQKAAGDVQEEMQEHRSRVDPGR